MNLYQLAVGAYLFSEVVDFDSSYSGMERAVERNLDLTRTEHRKHLLVWLNQWGCRQFKVSDHDRASEEILAWHRFHERDLPGREVDLWNLTDAECDIAGNAFGNLAGRLASIREPGYRVLIGPVGAAKIMFAVRPRVFPPWDTPIRVKLGHSGSGKSYAQYLRNTKVIVESLSRECHTHGFSLADLPARVGRPQDTVPKLVDKFYWITITRGARIPQHDTLKDWLQWSGNKKAD